MAVYHNIKICSENENGQRVVKHFNKIADKYDFMNTLLSFGIHHLWKRTAIRMLHLNAGDRVIDVCGGTGDLSLLASRRTDASGRVMLYDMSRAMLNNGARKVMRSPFPDHMVLVQGDAESISFRDNMFDAAMVGFGVRNLVHLEKGLREMHRVLKPGGRFMCLEFSKPISPVFRWLYDLYSFYLIPYLGKMFAGTKAAYTYLPTSIRLFPSPSRLRRMLLSVGFTDVSYKRLTNGIAVIHVGTKANRSGNRKN